MANKPRPENRHRMVRVEDDLWREAGEACRELGTNRSEVMRAALTAAVEGKGYIGPAPHAETPDDLRYFATHESLYRHQIFDVLMWLAERMEADHSARS